MKEKIDYNVKYALKSDPILSSSKLLKKDRLTSYFQVNKSGESRGSIIEDFQRYISGIQLIPQVPKEVKKVFNAAKRLYVFGYFEYYFFTISQHYAFLSFESAMRNKHKKIYGEPKNFIKFNKIINDLIKEKVIPKEAEELYDSGGKLRNSFSHLTDPPIAMPCDTVGILEEIAYQINQIYDDK